MKCFTNDVNFIRLLAELFKFDMQKYGQILCVHKPYFLMPGHIIYYGDNLYVPVAPNAVQEALDTGALEAEFDPLFDGDVDIEEGQMDVQDNTNRQETNAQENRDLQAALFDDTDTNILSRRRMIDAEYNNKVAGLNDSQRDAFNCVVQYTRARHQYYMRESESLPVKPPYFGDKGTYREISHWIPKCMHAGGTYGCCCI